MPQGSDGRVYPWGNRWDAKQCNSQEGGKGDTTPVGGYPDQQLIGLLTKMARHPRIRMAVISGRRLSHVEALVPVPGIFLAGTYGIELRTPEGERINRVEYDAVRPVLDTLKPRWLRLIAAREGFFLEDKGWALALHARFADEDETEEVLVAARHMATEGVPLRLFRLLGGHKLLEIGPRLAHKGQTVDYLLDRYPWPGALPVYLGDDDKDEEAFGVIKARGGIGILVASEPRKTKADCRLESPRPQVTGWKGCPRYLPGKNPLLLANERGRPFPTPSCQKKAPGVSGGSRLCPRCG